MCAIGIIQGKIVVTTMDKVDLEMDKKNRRPKTQWWSDIKEIQKVYGLIYETK